MIRKALSAFLTVLTLWTVTAVPDVAPAQIVHSRGALSATGYGFQYAGMQSVAANFSVLIVGGGGSGGRGPVGEALGGGSGGQVLPATATLNSGTTYTVTVGAGAPQPSSPSTAGTTGGASAIGGLTAGGGGGGGVNAYGNSQGPTQGAYGGGAGGGTGSFAGAPGLVAFHGGAANNSQEGGGGGAGANGGDGGGGVGGAGGAGVASSITGSSVTYGGGGGGGGTAGGAGGSGGGGAAGVAGTANTGGGGGGNAAGGSGIVVISYPTSFGLTVTSTCAHTTAGSSEVYTCTASGTFSFTTGGAPLLASLNTNFPAGATDSGCWSGQWASGTPTVNNPDGINPTTITGTRGGFNATGGAATYPYTWTVTARVRQVYPNQASLTAQTVSLSDYVYSSDTMPGVTTASCDPSPQPVANFVSLDRSVIGNSVTPEIVAFHRDAQQNREVVTVGCTATDGTHNSPTAFASATVVSGKNGDVGAVDVYKPTIDTSTMTDNTLVTVNCDVYPWFGDTSSVRHSSSGTNRRDFSPRYYLKNLSMLSAPPLVYVCATAGTGSCTTNNGNDTNCVVSTTAATAAATPCLTIAGALKKLTAFGRLDGAQIRLNASYAGGDPITAQTQNVACVTITRDPAVSRASAVFTFGAAGFVPEIKNGFTAPITNGCVRFNDVSILRTGTGRINGDATLRLEVQYDDVTVDNASVAQNFQSTSDAYWSGATIANYAGGILAASSSFENRMIRGVTANLASSGIDGNLLVSSKITAPNSIGPTPSARPWSGEIIYADWFVSPGTTPVLNVGDSVDANGVAVVQTISEYTSTVSNAVYKASADTPATGNLTHIIWHYNTMAGYWNFGRTNFCYDNTLTTHRNHHFISERGNVYPGYNIKGDVFDTDGTFVGNWGCLYGVGNQGEFANFIDANSGGLGTSFAPAYFGLGSKFGTSSTVPIMNYSQWTNWQATTNSGSTAVGGAGNGNYSPTTGSPLAGLVTRPMLAHDFNGTARPSSADCSGAFVCN